MIPIASSAAFTLAIGGFAVVGMPRLMKIPVVKKHSESETFVNIAFFTLVRIANVPLLDNEPLLTSVFHRLLFQFLLAIGLMNATFYGKSSFLLGAFLAGLCFCTVGKIQVSMTTSPRVSFLWLTLCFFPPRKRPCGTPR